MPDRSAHVPLEAAYRQYASLGLTMCAAVDSSHYIFLVAAGDGKLFPSDQVFASALIIGYWAAFLKTYAADINLNLPPALCFLRRLAVLARIVDPAVRANATAALASLISSAVASDDKVSLARLLEFCAAFFPVFILEVAAQSGVDGAGDLADSLGNASANGRVRSRLLAVSSARRPDVNDQ